MKAIDSNDGNVSGATSKIMLISTLHADGMLIGWAQASSLLPVPHVHFYKVSLIDGIPGGDTKLHIMNGRDTCF